MASATRQPARRQQPNAQDFAMERSVNSLIDSLFTGDQALIRIERLEYYFRRSATEAQCDYVSKSVRSFKEYVLIRKHLWGTLETGRSLMVQMHDDDLRTMLFRLSAYMQGGPKTKTNGGMRLKEITDWIDREFPKTGRYGEGLEATRNFLFRYPLLFELADSHQTELGDVAYVSIGYLFGDDGTIVLPEHVQSTGTVRYFNDRQTFGFLQFRDTSEDAYFPLQSIRKGYRNRHDTLVEVIQREKVFGFTAVVGWKYLMGKASNKWRVFKMWALEEDEEEASIAPQPWGRRLYERDDREDREDEEDEEEASEEASPRDLANNTTSGPPADPIPNSPHLESLKKQTLGVAPSKNTYAAKLGGSSKHKPRWTDLERPRHAKAVPEPILQMPTASATESLNDFLELLSHHFPPLVRSNRFGEVIDDDMTESGKPLHESKDTKQAKKANKEVAKKETDNSEDRASCSTDQEENNGALMRDIGCQTDFGTDRELLLQAILSNSEQLVELIRIAKSSGANL